MGDAPTLASLDHTVKTARAEMNDRRYMHRAVNHLLFYCRLRDAKMSRSTFMKKIMTYFLPFGGAPKTVGHGDVGND